MSAGATDRRAGLIIDVDGRGCDSCGLYSAFCGAVFLLSLRRYGATRSLCLCDFLARLDAFLFAHFLVVVFEKLQQT